MAPAAPAANARITSLDFDANRRRRRRSHGSQPSITDDDFDFMGQVADGIIERDRMRMRREALRTFSFIVAVMCCLCCGSIASFSLYGGRFLTDLHYTQFRVNAVSVTAALGTYLPVPLFGYLCDRYSPPPQAFMASILFGVGYILAAYTYKAGPPPDADGNGWPFGVMVLAFAMIGSGTSCMYISAVATCAKNFANAQYRGFMLAMPIAAFGLSAMWESQVGARLLYERLPNGHKGDVDVFKYFVFLAGTLAGVGLLGTLGLQIVDEEELIEHGVEALEQSGLLDETEFYHSRTATPVNYGTLTPSSDEASGSSRDGNGDDYEDDDDNDDIDAHLSESQLLKKRDEQARLKRRKWWLLNHATHAFLTDRTMWLLAAGFFLVTGPGEAYINNLGSVIPTLTPRRDLDVAHPPAGAPSTHVSLIALGSTVARLATGTLSDLFAPTAAGADDALLDARRNRPSFSRLLLLLPSALLLLLAFLNLALPSLAASAPSLLLLTSLLLGVGYGACFSLVPIIISVVWGVENFATNWGVVAMMPAGGAAVAGLAYSALYSEAALGSGGGGVERPPDADGQCHGYACFGLWAAGCAVSVAMAMALWVCAWMVWRKTRVVV